MILIDFMDKELFFQSICGCNVLLFVNGYNYELVLMGGVGGNCFVILMIGQIFKLMCKICVILEEEIKFILVGGVMNIIFIGEVESVSLILN